MMIMFFILRGRKVMSSEENKKKLKRLLTGAKGKKIQSHKILFKNKNKYQTCFSCPHCEHRITKVTVKDKEHNKSYYACKVTKSAMGIKQALSGIKNNCPKNKKDLFIPAVIIRRTQRKSSSIIIRSHHGIEKPKDFNKEEA